MLIRQNISKLKTWSSMRNNIEMTHGECNSGKLRIKFWCSFTDICPLACPEPHEYRTSNTQTNSHRTCSSKWSHLQMEHYLNLFWVLPPTSWIPGMSLSLNICTYWIDKIIFLLHLLTIKISENSKIFFSNLVLIDSLGWVNAQSMTGYGKTQW